MSLPSKGKASRKSGKILLIDDDVDVLDILKDGLQSRGLQVDAFSSPHWAIDSFNPGLYDLAILDIRIPGMNGFAVQRYLRKMDPSLKFIFLSAFEMHVDELRRIFPSMSDDDTTIVKKPVSIGSLVKEITPIMKRASAAKTPLGEHVIVIDETSRQFIDHAVEFLRIGLFENGEDAMLVTDAMPLDAIRSIIKSAWNGRTVNLRALEASGRLSLYTFEEWHMPEGKFEHLQSVARLGRKAEQSLARGSKGFRMAGDVNPLIDLGMVQEAVKYESALDEKFTAYMAILCAYTEDRLGRLHEAAIDFLMQSHGKIVGEMPDEKR